MKERYELPEDQCERFNRMEVAAMTYFMTAKSNLIHLQKDLAKRLEQIPNGISRMRLVVGHVNSIWADLTGILPDKQRKHLLGIANDMEIRLMPKMSPEKVTVVLTKDEAKELVNAAQEGRCRMCVLDADESRDCRLCKLLEVVVPLDQYEGTMSCPYSRAEWEDE